MTTARARLPRSPPVPITTPAQALQRAFKELRLVGEDDQHAIKAMVAEAAALIDETLRSEAVRAQMAERLGNVLKRWPTPAPPGLRWEERTSPLLPELVTVTMSRRGSQFRAPNELEKEKWLRNQVVALFDRINFPVEKARGAPVEAERIFARELRSRMVARNMKPPSALVTGLLAFFIGVENNGPGDDVNGFRKRWEGQLQRGAHAERSLPVCARTPQTHKAEQAPDFGSAPWLITG